MIRVRAEVERSTNVVTVPNEDMEIFLDANNNPFTLPVDEEVVWRISGYALVNSEEGKILMVVPTWNTLWELPGGGVEVSERIRDGIKRECLEETGYSILVSDQPFHVSERNFYHRHEKKYYHSVVMVYLGELLSEQQDIGFVNTQDGNEISKIDWVSLEELSEQNCHPTIYPAIQQLKDHPIR